MPNLKTVRGILRLFPYATSSSRRIPVEAARFPAIEVSKPQVSQRYFKLLAATSSFCCNSSLSSNVLGELR
jgi:hypothetical protein